MVKARISSPKNFFTASSFFFVSCLITGLLLAVGLRCFASPGDAEVDAKLERLHFRHTFEVAEALKPLDDLSAKYKKALEQQRERFQATGNLEGVIVVVRELDALEKGNTGEESHDADPAELVRHRGIFLREKLAINERLREPLARMHKQHTARLADLISELTRAGQIEQALRVQKVAEELREFDMKSMPPGPSGSSLRAGDEKEIEVKRGINVTFCWIPPGSFTMGSPTNEEGRSDNENQVEVTLSKGFWMAKTEVTQAQWEAVMGSNPSHFKGADLPVDKVSWDDVQEFLKKINAFVGNLEREKMVLPTEAQWEYACRAGAPGPYSGGSIGEMAWYRDNSGRKTRPVGTKKPNAWGLHDMHGNVREWCADWYASGLQGGVDPQGANSGTNRVNRGGGWYGNANNCRVADRNNGDPSSTNNVIGFRVARSSVP
jgi:formylglycine-generating enzyme required for sulfatase activity